MVYASERTVQREIGAVREYLGAANRAELAATAIALGLDTLLDAAE